MKCILRDMAGNVAHEMEMDSSEVPLNMRPVVIFIDETNACYRLVEADGDVGFFNECNHMRVASLRGCTNKT